MGCHSRQEKGSMLHSVCRQKVASPSGGRAELKIRDSGPKVEHDDKCCNTSSFSFNPEAWDEEEYLTQRWNNRGKNSQSCTGSFSSPQRMCNAAAASVIYISLREHLDLHFTLD